MRLLYLLLRLHLSLHHQLHHAQSASLIVLPFRQHARRLMCSMSCKIWTTSGSPKVSFRTVTAVGHRRSSSCAGSPVSLMQRGLVRTGPQIAARQSSARITLSLAVTDARWALKRSTTIILSRLRLIASSCVNRVTTSKASSVRFWCAALCRTLMSASLLLARTKRTLLPYPRLSRPHRTQRTS